MLTMSVESFQTSGSLSQALMSSCSVRELPKEFIAFPNPKVCVLPCETERLLFFLLYNMSILNMPVIRINNFSRFR